MFEDDKWEIFGTLAAVGCAFLLGRRHGENKTVQRYEAQEIINQQQKQIDYLTQQINNLNQKGLQ